MKLLLKHCDILAADGEGYRYLKDAYLGIDGSTIDYIGQEQPQAYSGKRQRQSPQPQRPYHCFDSSHYESFLFVLTGKRTERFRVKKCSTARKKPMLLQSYTNCSLNGLPEIELIRR